MKITIELRHRDDLPSPDLIRNLIFQAYDICRLHGGPGHETWEYETDSTKVTIERSTNVSKT